jgi:hypothetical protein
MPKDAPSVRHSRLPCRSCRLSKTRCDIELTTALRTGTCMRCARLGVRGEPNGPSMRGRRPRLLEDRWMPAVACVDLSSHTSFSKLI